MEEYGFNVDNWEFFCSFARWYPDLFLDLIKPQKGGLNLHLDQRIYLRAMLRFMSLYGVFPRGYGKCVAGDTLIFTDSGIKEIGELFDYNESGIETLYNTHIGIVNRYGKKENTKLGLYSGYCKTKTITTDDGFQICGTYNHPVLIKKENGTIGFQCLDKLVIGDEVIINRHNDLWGKNTTADIDEVLYNIVGQGLNHQCIPHSILEGNKQIVTTFLCKLFDKLSVFIDDHIYIFSKSEKFINQIQFMLLNYGIISQKAKALLNNNVLLSIGGNELYLFASQIGSNIESRMTQLNSFIQVNNFSFPTDPYYFSKVTSISDGENHVYDFHVESTHSFVSNGFVSHNTFNEVLASELACIFYPEITIALTAQTKENAAELLRDKHNEIMKFYPMLKNEVAKANFSKNDANILFKNGSALDNLANAQSSKGQRRRRMNEEESALIDNETFLDALLPIVEVPRVCIGKYSIIDPEELNQQINFFTTAGFKGSDEYQRSIDMVKDMVNLKGKIVLGSSFWLPCWYGRGSTKSQIFQKKQDMTTVSFAQNYESKWVGAATGALVNINKLIDCRSLLDTEYEAKNGEEYYIGVDVARSESTANNQSSVSVVRVKRNEKNNKVKSIECVNEINISNTMNFTNQAIEIKRLKKRYNARMVIADGNGLGSGLIDQLLKNAEDPITGDDLGCWNTINTDNEPESSEAESCLFDMKAQTYQNKVVSYFIDAVDSGKLRLLRQRKETDFSQAEKDDYENKMLPFIQTDFMVEEIANLKLKTLPSGSVTVEKTVSKMNKDRFSSLSYVIFYIMEFTNNAYESVNDLDLIEQYTFL